MLLYLYFRTVIVVLSGANIAFSLPSPQFEKIKQLVVFGDSFSDNGVSLFIVYSSTPTNK
jgi:phospholipase/lecithinase/hemolysin